MVMGKLLEIIEYKLQLNAPQTENGNMCRVEFEISIFCSLFSIQISFTPHTLYAFIFSIDDSMFLCASLARLIMWFCCCLFVTACTHYDESSITCVSYLCVRERESVCVLRVWFLCGSINMRFHPLTRCYRWKLVNIESTAADAHIHNFNSNKKKCCISSEIIAWKLRIDHPPAYSGAQVWNVSTFHFFSFFVIQVASRLFRCRAQKAAEKRCKKCFNWKCLNWNATSAILLNKMLNRKTYRNFNGSVCFVWKRNFRLFQNGRWKESEWTACLTYKVFGEKRFDSTERKEKNVLFSRGFSRA